MSDDPTLAPPAERPLDRATQTWRKASERAFESLLAANRAAIAAVGLSDDEREPPEANSVAYNARSWEPDRSIESPRTTTVGDRVEFTKTISAADVEAFANASGDTNRLHLDDSFAARTRFGGRIVHGTLVMGVVSAALARLPGLTIYLSQDQRFLNPAKIGDELRAVCEIVEAVDDDTYRVSTTVFNQHDEKLIDGEAVVLIDELPEAPE